MKLTKITDVSQFKHGQLLLETTDDNECQALIVGCIEQHKVYFESPVDGSVVCYQLNSKLLHSTYYIVESL